MRTHGRPVLGAFAGLFFGIFLDTFLLFRSAITVGSILVIVFPVAGFLLGVLWGYLAPLGSRAGAAERVAGVDSSAAE
jgi:hypothetical protein